ncbi:hypothetical protein ACU686_42190 [Yinghuangia aomiensis]
MAGQRDDHNAVDFAGDPGRPAPGLADGPRVAAGAFDQGMGEVAGPAVEPGQVPGDVDQEQLVPGRGDADRFRGGFRPQDAASLLADGRSAVSGTLQVREEQLLMADLLEERKDQRNSPRRTPPACRL